MTLDPAKYYEGSPCKHCSEVLRYKANGGCVACRRKKAADWKRQNRDRVNQYNGHWLEQNPDRVAAYAPRKSQTDRQWREQNPDRVKQSSKRCKYKRRASERIPYTTEQLKTRLALFGDRCVYCSSEEAVTVDHFLPLSLGGLDALKNIVPACLSCNSSKHAHNPVEWMQAKGLSDRYINTLVNLILKLANEQ